jgi:hypothetical protein
LEWTFIITSKCTILTWEDIKYLYTYLLQHYWEKIASKDIVNEDILRPYVEACVELCWYSVITCPPIDYIFTAEKLDDFRGYTKNGEEVDYVVWPAMYLHQFGPCLYKGVVQFKQGSQWCRQIRGVQG